MAAQAAKNLSENLISFFEDQYMPYADPVYRFAFALTLRLDRAYECLDDAFRECSSGLEERAAEDEPNDPCCELVQAVWKAFHDRGGAVDSGSAQSAVIRTLKPLTVEQRAALTAVDAVGLSPSQAATALGWDGNQLRRHLAAARESLLSNPLEI